jgi:hypothetical protein
MPPESSLVPRATLTVFRDKVNAKTHICLHLAKMHQVDHKNQKKYSCNMISMVMDIYEVEDKNIKMLIFIAINNV